MTASPVSHLVRYANVIREAIKLAENPTAESQAAWTAWVGRARAAIRAPMEEIRHDPVRAARAYELIERLAMSNEAERKLCAMTDGEVAAVIDEWHGKTDMSSPQSVLLETIVQRLQRAAGGPVPFVENP